MEENFARICKVSELSEKRGMSFELDDETEIALFKIDGKIHAVDNVCPHNHIPAMFQGYVEKDNIACPIHGFAFNVNTGEQSDKTGCRLRVFEVRIEDGEVYVKKPEKKIFDFEF
jgi:3-phenylpropionate/trans-cinnamate dioxygenase ferredoxin component